MPPSSRRTIRLFPDYGRDWPLWETTTSTWDVGYTTTPEMYGLTQGLSTAIAEWNAFWAVHFDPFEGWDTAAHRDSWRVQGEGIAARLRREVDSFADVNYEPWPLQHEG